MFILNFDPKTRYPNIACLLQAEHITDKACHEDAKYQNSFILTLYMKEEYRFEI